MKGMKKKELISIGERNIQLEIEYKNSYNITSMEHSMLITMLTLFKDKLLKYTKFCHLTLNISMFVPAIFEGGKWVVLEEPKLYIDKVVYEVVGTLNYEYQQAKDNVIFEGFEYDYTQVIESVDPNITEDVFHLKNRLGKWQQFRSRVVFHGNRCHTIQDLIKYKPTLTKYGQKQAGL